MWYYNQTLPIYIHGLPNLLDSMVILDSMMLIIIESLPFPTFAGPLTMQITMHQLRDTITPLVPCSTQNWKQ